MIFIKIEESMILTQFCRIEIMKKSFFEYLPKSKSNIVPIIKSKSNDFGIDPALVIHIKSTNLFLEKMFSYHHQPVKKIKTWNECRANQNMYLMISWPFKTMGKSSKTLQNLREIPTILPESLRKKMDVACLVIRDPSSFDKGFPKQEKKSDSKVKSDKFKIVL